MKEFKKYNKTEKEKFLISVIIVSSILLLFAFPLVESLKTNATLKSSSISIDFSMLPMITAMFQYSVYLFWGDINIAIVGIIVLLVSLFISDKKAFLIFFVSLVFEVYIFNNIYTASVWRNFSINLILLFIAWINYDKLFTINKNKNNDCKYVNIIVFYIVLSSSMLYGFKFSLQDLVLDFTSSQNVAEYLESNIPENSIIVCNDMPRTSSVIPYTNKVKYWNPSIRDEFSYVTWDEKNVELSFEQLYVIVNQEFESLDNIYFLDSGTTFQEPPKYFEKIEVFNKTLIDEKYILYKINKIEDYVEE